MSFVLRTCVVVTLLELTTIAYYNFYIFLSFIFLAYCHIFSELSDMDNNVSLLLNIYQIICFLQTIYNIYRYQQILTIITFNSVANIIHYCIGQFGGTKLFQTNITIQGLFVTTTLYYLINKIMIIDINIVFYNLLGVASTIVFDKIKKSIGLKQWADTFGPLGGALDIFEPLSFPIFLYLIL